MLQNKYSILTILIVINFIFVSILDHYSFVINTWIWKALGTALFLLPIEVLFFFLGKDSKLSSRMQLCCRAAFWFVLSCYFLGGLATLLPD